MDRTNQEFILALTNASWSPHFWKPLRWISARHGGITCSTSSCYLNQMSRLFHFFPFCKLPLGWFFNTSLVVPCHNKSHEDEPYLITGEPPLYGQNIADTAGNTKRLINPWGKKYRMIKHGVFGQNPLSFFVCFFSFLFGVLRPTREFFTHMETSPLLVNGCKIWPMLDTHGHWAVRVL